MAAASVSQLPIVDGQASLSFQIEGRPVAAADAPSATYSTVSDQYFEAMGIPILIGRGVARRDVEDSQLVAVINQNMASRFWPNDEPPTAYAPYRQRAFTWLRWTSLAVRTESEPRSHIASVRAQLLEIDPNQPVHGIDTLEQTVGGSVAWRRLNTMLVSLFALTAALLAALGIYGIVSYYVVQRTAESGLRRALGARAVDVLSMVVGQGLALTAGGVALGLGGALAVTTLS